MVCRVFRKIKNSLKAKRSHEKNACSFAEEQDIALLMPKLSSSGSPSAEIQLSCSESAAGGGEWVACNYPPVQPQEMQLQEQCLCKQEIDIDDYEYEIGTRWSDDSSTDQGTLSALTNCYDETALDWIFEDVATRDLMIMQARSIPSVRGDELLGDVINHHLQA